MVYIGLLIAAAAVGLDQLTKYLVVSNMALHESVPVLKIGGVEIINLSYYLNDGAAFSKFEGQTTMLIVVTSIFIAGLLAALLLKKIKRTPYILAASLMIGGGIGNLIDRIFNGGLVVDFIDLRIINFAIFNVADICAVCGAALMLLTLIIDEIKEYRAKHSACVEQSEQAATEEAEQTKDTDDGNI
ncbi:MAG: signal peptidase II [Oscillospiraceae bacterium]